MPSHYTRTIKPADHVDDPYLRMPHLIAASNLSKATLYAMIGRGEFPAPIKLGRRTSVWRASAINAWMAAQGEQQ